jgi:DNA repair ATPase RecN
MFDRISFEERTHQQTEERLTNLRQSTKSHQSALERLQSEKKRVQEEVGEMQRGIERLQEELQHLHELLEEANKNLDGTKRTAGKIQKAHDKAFKEIAGKVRCPCRL